VWFNLDGYLSLANDGNMEQGGYERKKWPARRRFYGRLSAMAGLGVQGAGHREKLFENIRK
jgi:hypothetical protein